MQSQSEGGSPVSAVETSMFEDSLAVGLMRPKTLMPSFITPAISQSVKNSPSQPPLASGIASNGCEDEKTKQKARLVGGV
jgi:hypothetical protein